MIPEPRRYYGKYRGKVEENLDPLALGRILVSVASVPGLMMNWALPCSPYGGSGVGFFAIPPIGASIWVEFEGGDANVPIWAGCFWEEGQLPIEPAIPEIKVLKTDWIMLKLDDTPGEGGVLLTLTPPLVEEPLTMSFDAEGIQILCGPDSIIAMTPESISLSTEPANFLVSPEAIEIEIAPSTASFTEEGIEITSDEVSITANVTIEGSVEVTGDIEVAGAIEVEGDIEVLGAIEVEGEVQVLGAITVEGEVEIAAASVEIEAAVIEVLGVVMVEGLVDVTGDLLVDFMQPSLVGMIV